MSERVNTAWRAATVGICVAALVLVFRVLLWAAEEHDTRARDCRRHFQRIHTASDSLAVLRWSPLCYQIFTGAHP